MEVLQCVLILSVVFHLSSRLLRACIDDHLNFTMSWLSPTRDQHSRKNILSITAQADVDSRRCRSPAVCGWRRSTQIKVRTTQDTGRAQDPAATSSSSSGQQAPHVADLLAPPTCEKGRTVTPPPLPADWLSSLDRDQVGGCYTWTPPAHSFSWTLAASFVFADTVAWKINEFKLYYNITHDYLKSH